MVLKQFDILMLSDPLFESSLNSPARGIGSMDNTSVTVSAFLVQVIIKLALGILGLCEIDTKAN